MFSFRLLAVKKLPLTYHPTKGGYYGYQFILSRVQNKPNSRIKSLQELRIRVQKRQKVSGCGARPEWKTNIKGVGINLNGKES
jgi:hypothetical protein